MLSRYRGQAGDTIVEVLIVLAILGSAISIAFATANRSLLSTRSAELSSQASSVLQSQVEGLRTIVSNYEADPTNPNPEVSGTHCVSGDQFPLSTDSSCTINGTYSIQITYDATQNDLYKLTASWADIQGQGTDTATLYYRIHT